MDDATVFIKFPGRGLEPKLLASGDKKEFDMRKVEDANNDVSAAELLCSVANTLEGETDIKLTFDTPSQNGIGKLTV